jgi:hypothetical protein
MRFLGMFGSVIFAVLLFLLHASRGFSGNRRVRDRVKQDGNFAMATIWRRTCERWGWAGMLPANATAATLLRRLQFRDCRLRNA